MNDSNFNRAEASYLQAPDQSDYEPDWQWYESVSGDRVGQLALQIMTLIDAKQYDTARAIAQTIESICSYDANNPEEK